MNIFNEHFIFMFSFMHNISKGTTGNLLWGKVREPLGTQPETIWHTLKKFFYYIIIL